MALLMPSSASPGKSTCIHKNALLQRHQLTCSANRVVFLPVRYTVQEDEFGLVRTVPQGPKIICSTGTIHYLPDSIVVAATQVRGNHFVCGAGTHTSVASLSVVPSCCGVQEKTR